MADWSEIEVDLIIEDYFQMLHEEIRGIPYNKAAHRKVLVTRLPERNEGSIEFKHQNISAVLVNHGLPYISGYKPRSNYQKLLEEKVLAYISVEKKIETDFDTFATQQISVAPSLIKYDKWLTPPPEPNALTEAKPSSYKITTPNYLEKEQRNRSVGNAGEELAYEYEKWRLNNAGLYTLAKEVKWVSKEQGDGAGYDILSKNEKGDDRYIEVKTTTLGIDTPIFFSKTENDFSNEHRTAFHLYRVFNVNKDPKMFTRNGSFKEICTGILPTSYKGIF